jgi:hypothetical protein
MLTLNAVCVDHSHLLQLVQCCAWLQALTVAVLLPWGMISQRALLLSRKSN